MSDRVVSDPLVTTACVERNIFDANAPPKLDISTSLSTIICCAPQLPDSTLASQPAPLAPVAYASFIDPALLALTCYAFADRLSASCCSCGFIPLKTITLSLPLPPQPLLPLRWKFLPPPTLLHPPNTRRPLVAVADIAIFSISALSLSPIITAPLREIASGGAARARLSLGP